MTARIHLVPVHHMAHRLGEHLPSDRATPEAAALLLHRLRYHAADIEAGVDEALRILAETTAAAASDRPWARALGVARDLTALGAIVACVFVWALPA